MEQSMNWLKQLLQALIAALPELFQTLRQKKYSVSTLAPADSERSNKKKAVSYVKKRMLRDRGR